MRELAKDAAAIDVTDLLTRYSFDLGGHTLERVVESWLNQYPVQWVRLAVIEALYQGRYKAFSVEQILNLWQRRGRSLYRFTHEFERIICGRFPNNQFIHHEAVHAPVPRSHTTKPSVVTSVVSPALIKPVQPIVASNEQAQVSSEAEEIATSTHLPEEKGISIWSPVDAAPELAHIDEIEPAITAADDADDVEPNENLDAQFSDAELRYAELTDSEFSDVEQETEQLAPSADEPVLYAMNQSDEEIDLELSDTDLDSTRPIPKGGPVPTFKPATSADLELFSNGNWSNSITHQQPIHQFIPTPEPSDFYSKLRAVALQTPAHEVNISHLTPADREHR